MVSFPKNLRANKLIQIFIDYWFDFKQKYPSYDNDYYEEIVNAIINCANPRFGFRQYMCLGCGENSKIVAFSCKSSFCLRCGRVKGEEFSHAIKDRLHPDVSYRHLVLTIPSQLREVFYKNRLNREFFNHFYKAGWACIQSFMEEASGYPLECGCVCIIHLVGRNCEYKPHLHILLMGGGINPSTNRWVMLGEFPYRILHLCWKEQLLSMIRDMDEFNQHDELLQKLDTIYSKGFVARIEAGSLPKVSKHLIRYLSKYLCRPQISQKRIKNYDFVMKKVEFEYNSHRTSRYEIENIGVFNFIGRLVQQILPKGFQRIRYYGLQATKNSNRLRYFVSQALGGLYLPGKSRRDSQDAKSAVKLGYRSLVQIWWGQDPFHCQKCNTIMELVRIWDPSKGFVFSLFRQLFGRDIGPTDKLPEFCFT